jgi:hypothetical protein
MPNPRQAVGVTGPAENIIRAATVTLTNAQIKTLPTTAVEIIPAPGANKAIVPLIVLAYRSFGTAYTNIDADGTLTFGTTDVAQCPAIANVDGGATALTTFLGDTAGMPLYLPSATGSSAVENAACVLRSDNGEAGAFTGGAAGNSLQVTVLYTIVDIAA